MYEKAQHLLAQSSVDLYMSEMRLAQTMGIPAARIRRAGEAHQVWQLCYPG